MILGVVQQGFGSFDAFNETLRDIFKQRTVRSAFMNSQTTSITSNKETQEKYEVVPEVD